MKKNLLLVLLVPALGFAQSQKQAEIKAKSLAAQSERIVTVPTQNVQVCEAVDVPYTQDFESVATPAIPDCTTIENAGLGNNFETAANPGYGFGTTKVLRYKWNTSNPANAWFYTIGLNLTAGTAYNISYRYGSAGSTAFTEKLKVFVGMQANSASMLASAPLIDHPVVNNNVTPITDNLQFVPQTTGIYYVAFNCYSNTDQFYLFVDDIVVSSNLATAGFDQDHFSFFPNPVVDVMTVSYNKNINSVAIYNLLGQKVLFTEINDMNAQIDLRTLSKGTYYASFTSGNEVEKVKIVKK